MKKTLTAKGFIARFACFAIALLILMGAVVFAVDPYFHYHAPLSDYVINDRFCMDGMIRSSAYDAALVGSSMCQNFDMDLFRADLGVEPIKAVKGGMTVEETNLLLHSLSAAGKAKRVYLSIDLTQFNSEYKENDYYPDYLINDSVLDDYRYLYGYEAWMRYLPLDLALSGLNAIGKSSPGFLKDETDPDMVGEWMTRDQKKFGNAEKLVQNYLNEKSGVSVSKQRVDGMYERMCARLDAFLETEPFDENVEYIVFLAPYSALYWYHALRRGYMDAVCKFREYYYGRLSEYENVRFFDFQVMEGVEDLNQYKDISHYHKDYNDLMVSYFASGEYEIDAPEQIAAANRELENVVRRLTERYPELKDGMEQVLDG